MNKINKRRRMKNKSEEIKKKQEKSFLEPDKQETLFLILTRNKFLRA